MNYLKLIRFGFNIHIIFFIVEVVKLTTGGWQWLPTSKTYNFTKQEQYHGENYFTETCTYGWKERMKLSNGEGVSLCPSFIDFSTASVDLGSKQETSWEFTLKDSTTCA